MGTRRPKQRLAFRGRLASQNQLQGDEDATMMDIDADDDLPEEQVVDKEDPAHSSDTLAGSENKIGLLCVPSSFLAIYLLSIQIRYIILKSFLGELALK